MTADQIINIEIAAPATGVAENAQAVIVGDEVGEGGGHAPIIAYGAR